MQIIFCAMAQFMFKSSMGMITILIQYKYSQGAISS